MSTLLISESQQKDDFFEEENQEYPVNYNQENNKTSEKDEISSTLSEDLWANMLHNIYLDVDHWER